MPNMCTCEHHYASHEGYNALTGDGGGKCMGDSRRCECAEFKDADKARRHAIGAVLVAETVARNEQWDAILSAEGGAA